ncbi:MAG: nucleotide pyrophosphohydrolase [Anaerolineales bacterium]
MARKFRYNVRHASVEPAPVPANVQTCLVWIRFSSSRPERLPDSGEPFLFGWKSESRSTESDHRYGFQELTDRMNDLVRSKGWYDADSNRPQTPRNLAISLALEAAEILEHFQFRENAKDRDELAGELADVALYLLQLASVTDIDLEKAILDKIEINKTREWNQE